MSATNFKLRVSRDPKEILNIFKEALFHRAELTVWFGPKEKRNVFQGVLTEIDKEFFVVKFDKRIDKSIQGFKENTVYFTSKFHNVLFKQEIDAVTDNSITVVIPSEIRVKEKRDDPRIYYLAKERKEIIFDKLDLETSKMVSFYCTLLNLSRKGASFLITEDQKNPMEIGRILYIQFIAGHKIPPNFKAKIIHIKPSRQPGLSSGKNLVVGVRFYSPLKALELGTKKEELYPESKKHIQETREKLRELTVSYNNLFIGHEAEDLKATLRKVEKTTKGLENKLIKNINYLNDKISKLSLPFRYKLVHELGLHIVATSFRLSYKSTILKMIQGLNEDMSSELLYHLQQAKPANSVLKAQEKVINYIKQTVN